MRSLTCLPSRVIHPLRRQQPMEVIHLAIGYPVKNISEPFGGIDIVNFTGTQQGVNNGCALCSFMVATEQVIFPTQS
jgi:hypothetical protein